MAEFPGHNISLVIDDRIIGTNLKISNLANMMAVAKYDVIAISDSDMRVGRDYLKTIVQPFKDDTVGAVTCLYSGRPINGLPSKLGATYINDWFLPSALIPATFGSLTYCFGATMAVRRKMFLGLGGFGALADFLADDYMLGHLVSDAGHKIVLAPYVVENVISETSLKSLFSHELRWARTIKSVQPFGYALSFITELLPLSVLTMVPIYLATGSALLAGAVVGGAFAMRIALHYAVSVTVPGGGPFAPWLIPLRDLLTASVRITSYFGTKVLWRESAFEIQTGNQLKIVE